MADKFELIKIRNGNRRKIAEMVEQEPNEWKVGWVYGDYKVFDLDNKKAVGYFADLLYQYLEEVRS